MMLLLLCIAHTKTKHGNEVCTTCAHYGTTLTVLYTCRSEDEGCLTELPAKYLQNLQKPLQYYSYTVTQWTVFNHYYIYWDACGPRKHLCSKYEQIWACYRPIYNLLSEEKVKII